MGVKVKEKVKGSGIWWIYIDHKGKRKAKMIGKDKRLAKEAAKKIEANLLLGDLKVLKTQPQVPVFSEYARKYLLFIKANRRSTTFERYEGVLKKYVLPKFKDMALDKITRGTIRDFLLTKSEEMDIGVLRDVLSGVLSYAVDDEVIAHNPVIGVTRKLEKRKDKGRDVEPFTEMELNLFLGACKDTAPECYPFFLTACRTGMRLGELLALRWSDIQFSNPVIIGGIREERPFILVRRSYRRGKYTPPKNDKTRHVDVSAQLKGVLSEHLLEAKKNALKSGSGEVSELIFNKEGRVMEQNEIRRIYNKILTKAKLRHVKFHALRHTFASLLLSKGESPVYVKEQMGHSSIQITCDIYGKWIPTQNLVGVNKLDSTQQSATQPQPQKIEKAQLVEIAPKNICVVPKTRLELVQAYAR
jgi:integrase